MVSFIAGSYTPDGPIHLKSHFTLSALEEIILQPNPDTELRVHSHNPSSLTANIDSTNIVIAGRLYNLDNLSKKASLDIQTSDMAEIFLRLYLINKEWLLQNINGKFVAAIHKDNKLTLIRDKVGEEQVYYGISGNKIVFSSAIKDIVKSLNQPFAIPNSLTVFETPINDETMFQNVYKVEPGNEVTIDLNTFSISKLCYWRPEPSLTNLSSEQEYLEAFQEILMDAIKIRLPENNISAFLSGGQDSSFICCMLDKMGKTPNRVYTTAWKDLDHVYNEIPWANLVARNINTNHIILQPSAFDFRKHYPRTMWILDEVKGNAAHFIEYWIACEASARGDMNLFSGYGADELLGGEIRYLVMYLNRDRNKNNDLFNTHPMLSPYKPLWDKVCEIPSNFAEDKKYFHLIQRGSVGRKDEIFYEMAAKHFNRFENLIDQMGATDIAISSQPLLDSLKINKYFGVDKICPFLDYRLFEFAFSLPESLKISGLSTKHILRLISRGLVPDEITDRTNKVGFAFPHNDVRYADFLGALANGLSSRLDKKIIADSSRKKYDRTILMAASQEILHNIYEDGLDPMVDRK